MSSKKRYLRFLNRTMAMSGPDTIGLPSAHLVERGIEDLRTGILSEEALLVIIAAPRLRFLGLRIPDTTPLETDAEISLYRKLVAEGRADAYSYYNSLIRAIVSFSQALEGRRGTALRAQVQRLSER